MRVYNAGAVAQAVFKRGRRSWKKQPASFRGRGARMPRPQEKLRRICDFLLPATLCGRSLNFASIPTRAARSGKVAGRLPPQWPITLRRLYSVATAAQNL